MYRQIDFEKVSKTLKRLQKRIEERFGGYGLSNVCSELILVASETEENLKRISTPNYWLRGGVGLVILVSLLLIIYTASAVELEVAEFSFAEYVQVAEAVINDLVIIGVSFIFLISLESRVKRHKIVKALNELRAIAHVVDMHQLTKDPTEIGEMMQPTASSPERKMDQYLVKRYLDYSSELLSLIGKIAAIYGQKYPESQVVASVNEIETLCSGISRKIWQKIMILEQNP